MFGEAIEIKSSREINALREAGRLVAETFALLAEAVGPGMCLRDLDKIAADYLERLGAQTLYKGYRGHPPTHPPFPGVICASLNNEICHGLPDQRTLKQGDIVAIDIGLRYKGFCGDSCVTYAVGTIMPEAQQLLKISEECLYTGIDAARVGNRISDIGAAVQAHAESHGFSVVRDWGGHGIGRDLHEAPSVMHVGPAGYGPRLRPGMVFTIEPMINAGGPEWHMRNDGWTVVTSDGSLSAQFEHMIAITESGPEILSK